MHQASTKIQQNGTFSSIKTILAEIIRHFPVTEGSMGPHCLEEGMLFHFYGRKKCQEVADSCLVLNSGIFCIEPFPKNLSFKTSNTIEQKSSYYFVKREAGSLV